MRGTEKRKRTGRRLLAVLFCCSLFFSDIEPAAMALAVEQQADVSAAVDEVRSGEGETGTDADIDSNGPGTLSENDVADEPVRDEPQEPAADGSGTASGKEEGALGNTETPEQEESVSGNTETPEQEESVSENTVSENSISANTLSADTGGVSIEASNGLGSLLMDELRIAAKEEQAEAEEPYRVTRIEVSYGNAEVYYNASGEATAVVTIYEEDGKKPLLFGYAPVVQGQCHVSVKLEGELPEGFLVKGYLVETGSLRPLSREYVSDMYTKAMQAFLAKTTKDFDEKKVLNLDEDEKTNFMVAGDGTVLIRETAGSGGEEGNGDSTINRLTYSEADRTYTFTNADDTVKALKAGDIFVYVYQDENGEEDYLTVKAGTVSVDESAGTVKITMSEDKLDADDVFSYIKIEEHAGSESMSEVDQDSCPTGVTYLGRGGRRASVPAEQALDGDIQVSYEPDEFQIDLAKKKADASIGYVSGSVEGEITAGLGLTVEVKYYLDVNLLTGNIWYVDVNFTGGLTMTGEIAVSGEVRVPLCAPLSCNTSILTVKFTPEFVLSGTFTGTYELSATTTVGFRLGDLEEPGFYWEPEVTLNSLTAKIDIYVGIDFNPGIKVSGILEASLEMGLHAGCHASVSNEDEEHECGLACVAGGFYVAIPFDGTLKILKLTNFELGNELGIEGEAFRYDFGAFYFSIKYGEFGWGECPHRASAEVTVKVQDADGNPVQGAVVSTSSRTYEEKTGEDGCVRIEAGVGETNFFAVYNEKGAAPQTGSTHFEADEGVICTITLGRMGAVLPKEQKVRKLDYGSTESLSHLSWLAITEDDCLYTWGNNDQNGILGSSSISDAPDPTLILHNVEDAVMEKDSIHGAAAAVTSDGTLYMWGDNTYGQLGLGLTSSQLANSQVPRAVETFSAEKVVKVRITCGTVAVVTVDGDLYMWGDNSYGRLGLGYSEDGKAITENRNQPQRIMEGVKDVKISRYNTMALTNDGKVYIWGHYKNDMLGDGSSQIRYAPDLDNSLLEGAVSIELSEDDINAAAITVDGSLYIWGDNSGGQAGIGSTGSHRLTKAKLSDPVSEILLIYDREVAVATCGRDLFTWGYNYGGVLGDGSNQQRSTPYKVQELADKGVREVLVRLACGQVQGSTIGRIYAVTNDDTLWQWGRTKSGDNNVQKPSVMMSGVKHIVRLRDHASSALAAYVDCVLTQSDGSTWQNVSNSIAFDELSFVPFTNKSSVRSQSLYAVTDEAPDVEALTATYAAADNRSPKTFTGLVPGELYNFYAMKSRSASAPLENYNMLSIGQGTADENGSLTVAFTLREPYDTPDLFVVGQTQFDLAKDLSKLTVEGVEDLTYNGEEQYVNPVVTYDGKRLQEGVDYYLSGDYSAKEVGDYTVRITGMGIYTGTVAKDYKVLPIMRTVAFDSDGGTEVPAQIVEDGQSAVEPAAPAKEGFLFGGWYLNNRKYDFTSRVTQDITLKARWTQMQKVAAPTAVPASGSDLDEGAAVTLRCQTQGAQIRYTVDGTEPTGESPVYEKPIVFTVYGDGTAVVRAFASKEGMVDSEKVSFTYTLKWAEDAVVTVTFAMQGHGTEIAAQKLKKGTTVKKPADPVAEGFVFGGWYREADCKTAWDFEKDTAETDVTLYAKWTKEGQEPEKPEPGAEDQDDSPYEESQRTELETLNAVVSQPRPVNYTGLMCEPAVRVTVRENGKKVTLSEGYDYRILYENNVSAGNGATVIVRGNGRYKGEKKVTFTIKPKKLSGAKKVVGGLSAQEMPDDLSKLPLYFYDGNRRLTAGVDYTLSGNAGSKVTATGIGNYTGTVRITFKKYSVAQDHLIGPEDITVNVPDMPYTGKQQKPDPVVTKNGVTLTKGKDYSVQYQNNINSGTAYVIVTGKKDYKGRAVQTFTISPSKTGVMLEVKPLSAKTFNGKVQKPNVTVKDGKKTLKKNRDYRVSYRGNFHAGKAAVHITGIGNYAGSVTEVTFDIKPQQIKKASVKGKRGDLQIVYSKHILKEGTDYDLQYDETSLRKGKIKVTITGKGDFAGSTVTKSVKAQ